VDKKILNTPTFAFPLKAVIIFVEPAIKFSAVKSPATNTFPVISIGDVVSLTICFVECVSLTIRV
jgi:hypothetical protein